MPYNRRGDFERHQRSKPLSDAEKEKLLKDPRTQIRISPAHFAHYVSGGKWIAAPHLKLLARKLVEVEQGTCKRLIVTTAPRHGKSEMISKYFPAWYLGLHPDKRIILASYEQTFAQSWGRKAQELLSEHGSLFGIKLNDSVSAMAGWETMAGGGMHSVGAGGSVTGKGANVFIIDDPLKNAEDAQSKNVRDKQWEWFQSTAYTRLAPGGAIIILQTRWNQDDLAGRLIEASENGSGDKYEVINLPAIAESEDDALGRKPGQALWPAMFDEEALARIQKAVGPYVWSALYQQRPAPLDGLVFRKEWFRYFTKPQSGGFLIDNEAVPETSVRKFQTVDLAASTKTQADYTVISTWGITPKGQLLLIDCYRKRLEGPDQIKAIKEQYQKHKPAYIGIEAVAYQLTLLQHLQRDGLPVKKLVADQDKVSRALTMATKYEAGMVYHYEHLPQLGELETELLTFPNGKHDDFVDCASYAALQQQTTFSFAISSNSKQQQQTTKQHDWRRFIQ